MITADQVWGTAVAAHRLNNGYFKSDVWNNETNSVETRSNKSLVKLWLAGREPNPVTENDIEEGREVRRHFTGYLLLQLAGKINEFQRACLKAAQKDEFKDSDNYDFSVISCLPYIMLKDRENRKLMDAIRDSDQIAGDEGQAVKGDIKVLRTRWSLNVGKYYVTAAMANGYVNFWFARDLTVDGEYTIKGKIKQQRGDNTTQLNYVKILVDKTAV